MFAVLRIQIIHLNFYQGCIFCFETIPPPPSPENHIFPPLIVPFFKFSFRFTCVGGETLKNFAEGAGPPRGFFFFNLTSKLSNLVPEKGMKTAQHSNFYRKLIICDKRQNFSVFYEEMGGKNPELEKWGKQVMIRVEFMCFICHFFPHLSKNHHTYTITFDLSEVTI